MQVDYVLTLKRGLSPYLRKCDSLQLSPDFLVPLQSESDDQDMTSDQTLHSTIVDCDDPMSYSSSSGSENMSMAYTNGDQIVRKKRSELNYSYVYCARSAHKVSDHGQDMASSIISRRKSIPHRSPLC